MPIFGKLGDLYGHRQHVPHRVDRRRCLTLATAFAPDAYWLIGLRTSGTARRNVDHADHLRHP